MRVDFCVLVLSSVLFVPSRCVVLSHEQAYDPEHTAVVIVPYADMLLHPARHYGMASTALLYKNLAVSCEPTMSLPCARVHQVLFNEYLFDAHRDGNEICGRIPQAVYGNDAYDTTVKKPRASFCTRARSVIFLADLIKKGFSLDFLPCLVRDKRCAENQETVTLMLPWTDPATNTLFSAGTRFVRTRDRDSSVAYGIVFVDFKKMRPVFAAVPKHLCVPEELKQYPRLLFVMLLKAMLDYSRPGIIPYVWGGSSFNKPLPDERYALVLRTVGDSSTPCYERPHGTYPHSGFDCSELVWRTAQTAGLNYTFKNTGMIEQEGRPLGLSEHVLPGDLIWIRGHVMIADPGDNTLIEAAGYASGFGKVQEIELVHRIYGISTYAELERAYREGRCIKLLDSGGTNATACKLFKLIKLV